VRANQIFLNQKIVRSTNRQNGAEANCSEPKRESNRPRQKRLRQKSRLRRPSKASSEPKTSKDRRRRLVKNGRQAPKQEKSSLHFAVNGMTAIEGTVLFDFQTTRGAPFVFRRGIVLVLALGALKLDDFSRHRSLPDICVPTISPPPGSEKRHFSL
jgi:hypothetical protein